MQAIWNRFNSILLVLIALMLAGALARGVLGGSLDPPGTPGPTMKTLEQLEPRIPISQPGDGVFPIVISQPGSYYLTGNITGVSGKDGIQINANDVTLDLNGFALSGVPGSGNGILSNSWGLAVENGSVRSWSAFGIWAQTGSNGHFRHLELRGNGQDGINLGGDGLVEASVATNNGAWGIVVAGNGIVRGCYVASNARDGIDVIGAVLVEANTVAANAWGGIKLGNGATATGNTVRSNGAVGIRAVASDETVSNNTVSANSGGGIDVWGQRNRIEGNTVTGNDAVTVPFGIKVYGTHNFIVRNSASYNVDNFDIPAGNTQGPEETSTAAGPWANVNY